MPQEQHTLLHSEHFHVVSFVDLENISCIHRYYIFTQYLVWYIVGLDWIRATICTIIPYFNTPSFVLHALVIWKHLSSLNILWSLLFLTLISFYSESPYILHFLLHPSDWVLLLFRIQINYHFFWEAMHNLSSTHCWQVCLSQCPIGILNQTLCR